MIPVLATYSNFLKRCFENIYINCVSRAHCIYFGTYSGLCYHTDGKSHQSFADVRTFSGLPHMIVLDPFSEQQAIDMLNAILKDGQPLTSSYYFRLRRTPVPVLENVYQNFVGHGALPFKMDIPLRKPVATQHAGLLLKIVIVTMGTVATKLGLDCVQAWNNATCQDSSQELPQKKSKTTNDLFEVMGVVVVSKIGPNTVDELEGMIVDNYDPKTGSVTQFDVCLTIEDDIGVLRDLVLQSFNVNHQSSGIVVSKTMDEEGPSFRTLEHCLNHHQYTVKGMRDLVVASL